MIIRISLAMLALSVSLLIVLTGLYSLHLLFWSQWLLQIALKIGLWGIAGLLLYAGVDIVKRVMVDLVIFFSTSARFQRQLWFNLAKQTRLTLLYQQQAKYLEYVHELNRQRLIKADNRKQIHWLAKSIQHELAGLKDSLPRDTFQAFRKQVKIYKHQQDSQSLLALQQQIMTKR